MSISNLITSDINAITVEYTASGAITGTGSINLKRFDNIVYCSISPVSGTANNTVVNIAVTPSTTIPTQYRPILGSTNFGVTVINGGNAVPGAVFTATDLSAFNFTIQAGGNFNGASGLQETLLIWRVNSV